MTESFIIYTPNPPSISTLTSSGKQSEWNRMKENLEKILENYKKNEYNNNIEFKCCELMDKSLEEMNHSQFYKLIKRLIEKIKEDFKENNLKVEDITFNPKDRTIFDLSFKNIISLVNIIIFIIENNISKGNKSDIIYDFAFKNKIPKCKDNAIIYKKQLSKIMSDLDSIQIINLCLCKKNEDNLNNENKKNNKNSYINLIFFFSLFFRTIFKSIFSAIIDLNIPPIDNYFINNSNPYLINEDQILSLGESFKDIIICNLILIKNLPTFPGLVNLNFKMYDSYQLELHNILTILLDNQNINDSDINKNQRIKSYDQLKKNNFVYSPKFNNNYLYVQHILNSSETSYFEFCLDFNSLDPLLFNSVNYLLIKFTCITRLNIILFPHKKINKRKLYINNCFYNKYCHNDEQSLYLNSTDDKKIYYQYLEKISKKNKNNNNFILKDEKLLNELFYSFNMNLISLSIILEKKIKELFTLTIDFSTYNNESISLCNYDNYNCSIICFIFDLFKSFQSQMDNCKINSLEIFYDDFLDEKSYVVETIKIKIPSCKNGFKLNNLKLNHINFNISNITLFLPFENFPSVNLTELIISNLSYNDLNNLVNAFTNNKNIFPVLMKLDLSLGIMVEDYNQLLEILLKECLPLKLIYFSLNLPFNISIHQLIDILSWIKCSHNDELKINLKIFHSQLSQCINQYFFKNCVNDLFNSNKYYFKQKNLLPEYTISDEQTIKFVINKYDKKDKDYFYKFIFCFEKKNELKALNSENKKIYENIFNFRGKFKKNEINIEIIN